MISNYKTFLSISVGKRIHWRRQIFQKSIMYLFDYRSKRVASKIILLFISTLIVVVHISSESIHSFMYGDFGVKLYDVCLVDHF